MISENLTNNTLDKKEKQLIRMRSYYQQNKEKIIQKIKEKYNERTYIKEKYVNALNNGTRKCIRIKTAKDLDIKYNEETGLYY